MLTTTTVSLGTEPVTTTIKNASYPPHLQHALIVDLNESSDVNFQENLPSLLNHLQNLAKQPVDMLQFCGETPSVEIWESLRDLKSISHLEMISGYCERCNIVPLDHVGASWPLKSILIGSACAENIKTAHLNTIASLTLDLCAGLSFDTVNSNGSSNLQCLTIIENDACDHFIKLQEETSLLQNLSELTIQSTIDCDFCHQYEKDCFGKALIQCQSLTILELSLFDKIEDPAGEQYLTELPKSFPVNIEVLRFRGPPTLANRLSVWSECASNPEWLPKLKSIRFSLDVRSNEQDIPSTQADLADQKCRELLKTLVSLRPNVSISD